MKTDLSRKFVEIVSEIFIQISIQNMRSIPKKKSIHLKIRLQKYHNEVNNDLKKNRPGGIYLAIFLLYKLPPKKITYLKYIRLQ